MQKLSYKVLLAICLFLLLVDIKVTKNTVLNSIYSGYIDKESDSIIEDTAVFESYDKLINKVLNVGVRPKRYHHNSGIEFIDAIKEYDNYFDFSNYLEVLDEKYRTYKNISSVYKMEIENTAVFYDENKVFFIRYDLKKELKQNKDLDPKLISFLKDKNVNFSELGIIDLNEKDGEYLFKKVTYSKLRRIEDGKDVMKDIPQTTYMLKQVKDNVVTLRKILDYKEISGKLYYRYDYKYLIYSLKDKLFEYHDYSHRAMNFNQDYKKEVDYYELKKYFHYFIKFTLLICILFTLSKFIRKEKS